MQLEPKMLLCALPLLAVGCPEIKTDGDTWGSGEAPDGEPAETTETEDDEPSSCLHEWTRWDESDAPITAVCLSGDYANAPFFSPTIEAPCGTEDFPRTLLEGQMYTESSVGDPWLVQAAAAGFICDADDPNDFEDSWRGGGGNWQLRFEPEAFSTCDDYTVNHTGYVVQAGMAQQMEPSFDPLQCPYVNEYSFAAAMAPAAPLANAVPTIESAPTPCVPGSGEFEFVVRDTATDSDGTVGLRLTPIAADGPAPFPERAWLRKLVVDEWGTVNNLRVAGLSDRLHQNGSRVWGGHGLDADEAILAFAPGQVVMSAMFATSEAELADIELPRVTLTWSCQVDGSAPHFDAPPLPGYMGALPPALGLGHRVTAWLDWDHQRMALAPQGRYADRLTTELVPIGPNRAKFSGTLTAYGATISGNVKRTPDSLKFTKLVLDIDGSPMGPPPVVLGKIHDGD